MTSRVIFHLAERFCDTFREQPHLQLYKKIEQIILTRGGAVEVRARDEKLRDPVQRDRIDLLESKNLHIIENGTVRQTGVLNSTLAYLSPFYHLDPNGVLANSVARSSPNTMAACKDADVEAFWGNLQQRFVKNRYSRYSQPSDVSKFPSDCIAVFLQGRFPMDQKTAYCSSEDLLRAVSKQSGGRPIVVKAHPASDLRTETGMIERLLAEGIELFPTDANIHDILPQCVATVSFNSAVALEGFLYSKPAILFGQADFHHVCETVRQPDQFDVALAKALATSHDYPRFLYWYFTTFCLSLKSQVFEPELLDILSAQGFDPKRLGLRIPPRAFFSDTDNENLAVEHVRTYFEALPTPQTIENLTPLAVTGSGWRFEAKLDGKRVLMERFRGEHSRENAVALVEELERLEDVFKNGDCQFTKKRFAYPHDGIVVLQSAPGERLDTLLPQIYGAQRESILEHAGRWLAKYSSTRQRQSTFAPLFWIKRLNQRQIGQATTKQDSERLKAVLEKLRGDVASVRGCFVRQAASHGDFRSENLFYDGTKLYGVGISEQSWIPLARDVAKFLVWQQLNDPTQNAERTFGINTADMSAFLDTNVLASKELITTLPFFIGEQLYLQLVGDYEEPEIKERARTAIDLYLARPGSS